MIEKLYEEYGKLMIQAEIVQAKINDVKAKIAQELNKTPLPVDAQKAATNKEQENG